MKGERYIVLLLSMALLCGCATSRRATKTSQWQTAQTMNDIATVTLDSMQYTIGCSTQVIRDSLIIISVRPMIGLELGRLEITPDEVMIIDKVNHQYSKVAVSKALPITPKLRWSDLQHVAAGDKKQKGDKVLLTYSYQGHLVQLDLTYGDITYDGSNTIRRLNVDRYKYKDIIFLK